LIQKFTSKTARIIMDFNDFPVEFKQFLVENGIDSSEFECKPPRFIYALSSQHEVESVLGTKLVPHWFPGFYSLPAEVKIHTNRLDVDYFGMDVASAIACHALDIQPNDQILDLCCAPGAKARYMALRIGGCGTITGVDVSRHRLSTAKRLLQRSNCDKFRLFNADGCTFDIRPPTRVGSHVLWKKQFDSCKILDSERAFHATRLLRGTECKSPEYYYDKVIVDAECTHDGSVVHIEKMMDNNWKDLKLFLDPKRLETLETLQKSLLENGFRLCKPGGIIVYSTCSFSARQNENIVKWLLDKTGATLEHIPDIDPKFVSPLSDTYQTEMLQHCLRFTPKISGTSGFFVARIRKPR
jgi:16S rRNA C967 or C1407 C5-methylase (RsmB/RsmF family)